ncbi:MAG: DUF3850 domain-containing protein [Thermoplasmatota archaeon]
MAAKMRVHDLKVWTEHFAALASGKKPFEIRKADRDFQVGDVLLLREVAHAPGDLLAFTGRAVLAVITSVTLGPVAFGAGELLPAGVAVLGVKVTSDSPLLFIEPNRAT